MAPNALVRVTGSISWSDHGTFYCNLTEGHEANSHCLVGTSFSSDHQPWAQT